MSLKDFTDAYVECAFWATVDDDGVPFDALSIDLAPGIAEQLGVDCEDFYSAHFATWRDAGMDDAQAGHDFWLTRNGHGAGFWDRGIGEAGDALTAASKAYGTCDLYMGDDGMIYAA